MANYTPQAGWTAGIAVTPNNNVAAASDSYTVLPNAKYVLQLKNTTASANTVKLDDPNSIGAVGATTAQDPDITITVPVTTGERFFFVDTTRFMNTSTNQIVFTNSATGAGVTHNLFGPI